MSGSSKDSDEGTSDGETLNLPPANLTNLALGEGQLSGRGIGISTPLSYPPHEKGAVKLKCNTCSSGAEYVAAPDNV